MLHNVCGVIKPGRLLAIMGPTGSGKTTLLTALAGRLPLEPESKLLVNGAPIAKDYKRQVAFVLQDDVLFENLTVEQTLYYTAALRLGGLSKEELRRKVDQIIDMLNVNKARETRIGGPLARGVSGGERKRVNIGNELLTDPSLILLDEPTSGLDTSTGINLMQLLKGMTEVGLTVAAAIHQPSSQMFSLFDDLMILVDGSITYYGPADEAVSYFARIGFKCSAFYNPADFMMGLILQEELQKQGGSSMRGQLIEEWKKQPEAMDAHELKSEEDRELLKEFQEKQQQEGMRSYGAPFWKQVMILTERSFFQSLHVVFNFNDFFQTFFTSVIVAVLWWQLPYNLEYLNDRIGLIFFVTTYVALFFPAFKALFTFPSERAVILRERTSGSYRLSAYFVSKCLNEFPFMWEHPLLMLLITYFTTNWHLDANNFFIFFGICMALVWTSAAIGLFVSAICGPDLTKALTTMTLVAMTQFLTGGFFVQHFPVWIQWLYYLSFIKYTIDGAILNEFVGTSWYVSNSSAACSGFEGIVGGQMLPGEIILNKFNIFIPSVGLNVLVILGYGLLFRVLGYLALMWSMAAPKPNAEPGCKAQCESCCEDEEEE
uniref:ABC transporter domain-containing protein n=1 Tax=Arcella intermedia TaxID=1963864 RepID=A0A6B2L030_9EUKA